jgi:hypothetical protein
MPSRVVEGSSRRSAEEEAPIRCAGRWVLATLAAAAAATADDVIMDQLNCKRFTAVRIPCQSSPRLPLALIMGTSFRAQQLKRPMHLLYFRGGGRGECMRASCFNNH